MSPARYSERQDKLIQKLREAQVDALHAKAMALGGKDEGAPGFRGDRYYMSYFRDLDGNKLAAFAYVKP